MMKTIINIGISIFTLIKIYQIMATQAEHAQALRDVKAQIDKAKTEITDAVKKLEDALAAAGNTTPEVDEALAGVKTAAQSVDDINPDVIVEPVTGSVK